MLLTLDSQAQQLTNAMAAFAPSTSGDTTLARDLTHPALTPPMAAHWQ